MVKYYPSINVLRGIAALLVCVFHFSTYSDSYGTLFDGQSWIQFIGQYGYQGIYLFFVISGFVIPLSMVKYNYGVKSIHKFIGRRWVRIEIPYLTSVVLILAVQFLYALKNENGYNFEWLQLLHHTIYTIPFTEYEWYNVIYWTLAIEFQFYILIALCYFLLIHNNSWIAILSLLILSALGIWINDMRFVFYYMPVFGLGILLFLFMTKRIQTLLFWGAVLIICPIIYINFGGAVLITSLIALLFIYTIQNETKPGQFLGNISYSLYLTHGLVGGQFLYFLNRHVVSNAYGKTGLFVGAIVISIGFAYCFWYCIERPAIRWSKKVKI